MKKNRKHWKKITIALVLLLLIVMAIVPFCTRGITETKPQLHALKISKRSKAKKTLKVMTFNIAHGRKDGYHQMLQSKKSIHKTLDSIAQLFKREHPDIIALQEADGPSMWSGNFNHVQYLTQKSFMAYYMRGEHVKGLGLSYGTALLSVYSLQQPLSYTFSPSWPTFSKGFVVSAINWPKGAKTDVVSVHLDFSRASIRKKQINEMIAILSKRNHSLVVMGDLNCQWMDQESSLRTLAKKLQLTAYKAKTPMPTFPSFKKRLDWILISKNLKFIHHKVVPDVLSDHYAVYAELGFKEQ